MKDKDLSSDIPAEYTVWLIPLFGIIMLIGAIQKWKWVLQMQGTRPFGFLYWLGYLWGEKGYRVGMILLSIIIIICGLLLAFFM